METGLKAVGKSQTILLCTGLIAVIPSAFLLVRFVWEETILTWREGPQMVGFSLMHGPAGFLILSPFLLSIWTVVALVMLVVWAVRKRKISIWTRSSVATAALILGVLSLPACFWQWLCIGYFAESPHAGDLLVNAAAEGNMKTARRYLERGVPVDAKNYEGSTAAFIAAVTGNLPMLQMLAAKGANLNAANLYGDSPLGGAVDRHQDATAAFLRQHGAVQIQGTPEQRRAAIHMIVTKQMEEMHP